MKNEEEGLESAIRSVFDFIDHITIWDTGSTDATLNTAKKYADQLYTLKVPEEVFDFGQVATMVCHLSKCDWTLLLDGDEILSNANELLELIEDENYWAWKFPRRRWADLQMTKQLEQDAWPDFQFRLFLNDKRSYYEGPIHSDFHTDHPVGQAKRAIIEHFVDPLHLANPIMAEERNRLRAILSNKTGKEPEGSLEAKRLAGFK